MPIFRFFMLAYLLLITQIATAKSQPVELDDTTTQVFLYPHVEVAEDPTSQWQVQTMADLPIHFQGNWDYHPQIGYTRSTWWARFDVISQAKRPLNVYVLFRGQDTSMVWAYIQPTHATPSDKPSSLPNISHFRMPAYELTLMPGKSYTIYLQVKNPNIPLSFELELRTAGNLLQSAIMDYLFYGAILGGMLALAAYNLLTFLKLHEVSFLSLSLLILTSGLELSYLNGMLNYITLLGAWYDTVPAIFTQLAVTSGASFIYHLLEIPRQLPSFKLPFQALMVACVVTLLLAPIVPYDFMMAGLLALALLVLSAPVILILSLRGRREAQNTAWAYIVITLTTTPLLLIGIGVIDNWPKAMDLTQLGIMAFMILLSLTQAERTRELREQSQRAEAASLAKGEFLASMSHEIRTPMNAVINTGGLLKKTPLTPLQRDYVNKLETASNHTLNLINDILDLARLESPQHQLEQRPFNLGELLESLENLLQDHALQKNLRLHLQSTLPADTTLLGDPTRLTQILLNLLNNGLKFTEQGHVNLLINEIMHMEKEIVRLHFEVIDTGCGLSPQQQERLFEPFSPISQSTNKRYQGTGLGLSISSKLVAAMGGELEVSSQQGKGSRFFFTLDFPLQRLAASKTDPTSALPAKPVPNEDLRGRRILLVDDDAMNLFFGRELLKTLGVEVITADSGMSAIQQLQQETIHLVFMDISMPEMDGYETTRQIRSKPPFSDLPIIALTAHAIGGERERCLASGMNDYLTKPFDLEQLRTTIITYAVTAHAQDSFQSD